MTTDDDIAFLELFRERITAFLVAGVAPTQDPLWGGSGLTKMKAALLDPAFRDLRQDILQMKGRAAGILEALSINCSFEQYPPPAVGGPVVKFPLFDLITDNQSLHTLDGSVFTDKIDEAIGLLRAKGPASPSPMPIFEVRKLADALDFYGETLGFELDPGAAGPSFAIVARGAVRVLLRVADTPRPASAFIAATDPKDLARMRAIDGLTLESVNIGDIACLALTDPDGNRLLFGNRA